MRDLRLEARITDLRGQIVTVRQRQRQEVVEVADQPFDHPAGVEAGRPRIGAQVRLRPDAVGVHRWQRLSNEAEVAHPRNPGITASAR